MNMIKTTSIAGALAMALSVAAPADAQNRQDDRGYQQARGEQMHGKAHGMQKATENQARRVIEEWPEVSRKTAQDMMNSYGAPDVAVDEALVWFDNGPWNMSVVSREPVEHNFPMPHQDVLAQTVYYNVPVELFDDIAKFDGSVILDRTKGTITARCDNEAANFLALNLAHDIVENDRSISDARRHYAEDMKQFMDTGDKSRYLRGLQFDPLTAARAGDPDERSRFIAMGED